MLRLGSLPCRTVVRTPLSQQQRAHVKVQKHELHEFRSPNKAVPLSSDASFQSMQVGSYQQYYREEFIENRHQHKFMTQVETYYSQQYQTTYNGHMFNEYAKSYAREKAVALANKKIAERDAFSHPLFHEMKELATENKLTSTQVDIFTKSAAATIYLSIALDTHVNMQEISEAEVKTDTGSRTELEALNAVRERFGLKPIIWLRGAYDEVSKNSPKLRDFVSAVVPLFDRKSVPFVALAQRNPLTKDRSMHFRDELSGFFQALEPKLGRCVYQKSIVPFLGEPHEGLGRELGQQAMRAALQHVTDETTAKGGLDLIRKFDAAKAKWFDAIHQKVLAAGTSKPKTVVEDL